MCGIAGYIGKRSIDQNVVTNTLNVMKNRGPDNQASWRHEHGDLTIELLHSRLSIIDLDPRSNQPFNLSHLTIVFNGEIYNYVELRNTLVKEGATFRTQSDTEVLLHYYMKYGKNCVDHFEGMWSFAIYDDKKKELFLSRDRFAEKPLYYYEDESGFYFGSEIKFIKILSGAKFEIDYDHILRYMVNGYKSVYKKKQTFFKDIEELRYASNLTVNFTLEVKEEAYWAPKTEVKPMSLEESIEGTRELLIKSMKLRLRSDVPLAFCLSGGVDSASLVSIAAKEFNANVATFSIIDKDVRYDERENIQATVNDTGCSNTMIELSNENMLERLKTMVEYHDAPIATISYLIHSQISEKVKEQGFKVAFSGTSGDELFTGYYDHFNLHLYEMRNHPEFDSYLKDWQNHTGRVVRNPYLKNPNLYMENRDERGHVYMGHENFEKLLKRDFHENFQEENFSSSLLRNRMLNELFHEATPYILHEDDLNSMKYSIENRSPFLDTDLFNFAYSIPTEHLIKDGYGKYVLRESVKGILNDQVRLDRQKKGFNASLNTLIDFSDPDQRDMIFDDSSIFDIVDKEKIRNMVASETMPNSISKFMFGFLSAKTFIDCNK